jgi:hypothetical protein
MTWRTLAVLGGLALLLPVTAAAEEPKGGCACCAQGGHGSHDAAAKPPADPAGTPLADAASAPAPPYEIAYEGLVAGVIQSVMRHPGMDVELTIGVGEKTFAVLVAPMNWLDEQQAVFRSGERAEIVGARLEHGSGETIVAREIYTAGQTLVVRDSEGRPLWN